MTKIVPQPEPCSVHSICAASLQTGLSAHLIRIWEKRYKAVVPCRSGSNRRLYSDADLHRLRLLKQLTDAGHPIGNVAGLPLARLEDLTRLRSKMPASAAGAANADFGSLQRENQVEGSLEAIRNLDGRALEQCLMEAVRSLGQRGFLIRVAAPLAQAIGEAWSSGSLNAAHEHFASAQLKTFLATHCRPFSLHPAAPTLLVGTPVGQVHEIGAAIVAAAAVSSGWNVLYLGSNLGSPEIAHAAIRSGCRAVALSIVYPENDPAVDRELLSLRRQLPERCILVVGGRAAGSYAATLRKVGAESMTDLERFFDWLQTPLGAAGS